MFYLRYLKVYFLKARKILNFKINVWKYNYPASRFEETTDNNGKKERVGVIGQVELIQKQIIASQE